MTLTKICGLRSPQMVQACLEAGADFVGFVFVTASPRFIDAKAAQPLIAQAKAAGVQTVGLWQAQGSLPLTEIIDSGIDILQAHGALDKDWGVPVWRALGVSGPQDLPQHAQPCARLLLDATPPAGSAIAGGNGAAFDWRILQEWDAPQPWVLAGGLTPANVAQAIAVSGAQAVDVSSGVERRRGEKDADLIRTFIRHAKAATARP